MKLPHQLPELGFYYHYKHDPAQGITHYAYEVVGVGIHTEDNCRPEDANMVIYRPLYDDSSVYKAGKLYWLRPLAMLTEMVTKDGKTFPRFSKIVDSATIAELEAVRKTMY